MKAAEDLVTKVGGKTVGCLVVIELEELKGRNKIKSNVKSIFTF